MKKHWKNSVISLLVLGFLLFYGGLAGASSLTVNLVNGAWENEVFTQVDVDYDINNSSGGGTSTIYWGDPASEAGQSGYEFDSVDTPFVGLTNGTLFELGFFTHENRPIWNDGGSLDSVDLLLDLGIENLAPFDVTFAFDHDETTNTDDPYASRDIVTILNLPIDQIFSFDDTSYYFSLLGFSQDSGDTITDEFLTFEDQTNTAALYAQFTTVPVPEPSAVLLFGIGLMGLVAVRRKTQK